MTKFNLKDWWIVMSVYFMLGAVIELINANYSPLFFNAIFAVAFYQKSKLVYYISWILVNISIISTMLAISKGLVMIGTVKDLMLIINITLLLMIRQQIQKEGKNK